jgi:hypothetical protein
LTVRETPQIRALDKARHLITPQMAQEFTAENGRYGSNCDIAGCPRDFCRITRPAMATPPGRLTARPRPTRSKRTQGAFMREPGAIALARGAHAHVPDVAHGHVVEVVTLRRGLLLDHTSLDEIAKGPNRNINVTGGQRRRYAALWQFHSAEPLRKNPCVVLPAGSALPSEGPPSRKDPLRNAGASI